MVRRDGSFSNAQGLHDFNEQLTEPIIRHVASPWEKLFSRRLAPVLSGLSTNGSALLTKFHHEVETRVVKNGASIAAFQMLKQQLPVYKETLKDASTTVKDEITTKQRDINREFVPKVKDNMLDVYNTCLMESGPGQFNRMKGHMDRHVETSKQSMFDEFAEGVRDLLTAMLKEVKKSLMEKIDDIFMSIKRDYTGVVVGQEASDQAQLLPREQRSMRKTVLDIVDAAELAFKRAVGLEPEEEIEIEEDVDNEAGLANDDHNLVTDALKTEDAPDTTTEIEQFDSELRESPEVVNDGEPSKAQTTTKAVSIGPASSQPDSAEENPLAAFLRPNTDLGSNIRNAEGPRPAEDRATSAPEASATGEGQADTLEGHRAQSVLLASATAATTAKAVLEVTQDGDDEDPVADAPFDESMTNTAVDTLMEDASSASEALASIENPNDKIASIDGAVDEQADGHAESQSWSFAFGRPQGLGSDMGNNDVEADDQDGNLTEQPTEDAPADEAMADADAAPEASASVEKSDAKNNSTDGRTDEKEESHAGSQNWSFDFDRPQGLGSDKENNDMEADDADDIASTASAGSGWGFERL